MCRARSNDESRWGDKKYAGATTAEVRLPDNNALAVAVCTVLVLFLFVCRSPPRRPLLCAEHEKEEVAGAAQWCAQGLVLLFLLFFFFGGRDFAGV